MRDGQVPAGVPAKSAITHRRGRPSAARAPVRSSAGVASTGNPAAAAGAQEGSLDLEMAHALAPRARLIYMEVTGGSHVGRRAVFRVG